jgi:hypothetical protein
LITGSQATWLVFEQAIQKNAKDADLIVVLQKITAKEPLLVKELLSTTLVEELNTMLAVSAEETEDDAFLKSNLKSILSLITEEANI